jgi:hypothetical protein
VSSSVTGGSTNGLSVVGACDDRADDEASLRSFARLVDRLLLSSRFPARRGRGASEHVRRCAYGPAGGRADRSLHERASPRHREPAGSGSGSSMDTTSCLC